ncbi:MAG: helix-hairpin-helix domain-containing protein [Salinivirgaceae bacterium]
MARLVLIVVLSGLIPLVIQAQETPDRNHSIEDLIEEIASGSDAELDYTQITEELYNFIENSINLNNTTHEQLNRLHMLTDFQIKSLLAYLKYNQGIHTIYELQLVPGFDQLSIQRMLPFVTVEPVVESESFDWNNAFNYGRNELFARASAVLETADGYRDFSSDQWDQDTNKFYPGNRMRIFSRYQFKYKNHLRFGVTAEKDPGETFFSGAQKQGFDYYSIHFELSDVGKIEKLVLGDFQAKMGQGLILWSGMSTGKSVYVMDIRKRAPVLSRFASTDENRYMRGAGLTMNLGNFNASFFASHKSIDANLQTADSLIVDETYASSLLNSGIHATPAQLADKNAIQETVAGGNVSFLKNNFSFGISGLTYTYSEPIIKAETPANRFEFTGKQNQNLSADVEFLFKDLHVFAECAISANSGKALLAGALMKLAPQLSASVLYRNYAKDYQAFYAGGFAEGSKTQNEKGVYLGLQMHPIKNWKLAAYYDFYQFPWLTGNTDAPSKGTDYLVQADYVPKQNLSMYWRAKHEVKQRNAPDETIGITDLVEVDQWNLRYHINYQINSQWQFKNRVELSHYQIGTEPAESGFVLYQDVSSAPFPFPLTLSLRYALFDTDSYNSRIYTYESDVLYAFSIPALYDKGTRFYVMARYQPSANLTLWLRYSQTWYSHKTELGSGIDRIAGNTRSEIKVQVRWKF